MFNNEFLSTGNKELDQKLNGGIAKSSLFSLIGEICSDKTEFMLNVIKYNKEINKNFNVLYVDTDALLDKKYLKELGIDNIDILRPNPHKIQLNLIQCSLNSNVYDLIVIDSVNSLFAITEVFDKSKSNRFSTHILSEWLTNDIMSIINSKDNKTSIVFIEHIMNINATDSMEPFPIKVGTGKSIGHYALQRLLLKKNESKYQVIKNRLGKDELDEVA